MAEVDGLGSTQCARRLNDAFHNGAAVRTASTVNLARSRFGIYVSHGEATPTSTGAVKEQEVEVKATQDGTEARSTGSRIKTVDDLLRHIEADLTRFEVAQSEATKYETATKDPATGRATVHELHRVFVRLKPKAGPSTLEQVEAIISGALATRTPVAAPRRRDGNADILQGLIVNDVHVGKLAWADSTGGPHYDTGIAVDTLRQGVAHLMAEGDARQVGTRHFWLLGDYFHHDGQGTTTGGTIMDYDSRVQKMLRDGSEVLFDLIAASAERVPTTVVLVPGNHDRTLTWALQRILVSEFRRHKGVTIDDTFTTTKWLTHGKCLIGLDHGDKGKKRLPEVMAAQCAVEWGQTTCRHIHTGHLHGKAKIVTEGGVVVWTHDSLKPADQWHTDEKFNTSPRTIEAYRYHAGGMFAGSDAWSPDLHAAPKSGLKRAA